MLQQLVRDWKTWPEKAHRYSLELLNVVGHVASIAALYIAYHESATESVFSLYIIAVATLLGLSLAWNVYRFSRKATYAEVLTHLHHTIHYIRDVFHRLDGLPEEEFKRNVKDVVDACAVAFSIITRTNC